MNVIIESIEVDGIVSTRDDFPLPIFNLCDDLVSNLCDDLVSGVHLGEWWRQRFDCPPSDAELDRWVLEGEYVDFI